MKINNCNHCGNSTSNNKFCSRSCAAKETNKVPKRVLQRKCTHCDSLVKNYRTTLCEVHFEEYTKNKRDLIFLTIEDYTQRDSIKKLHTSSKFAHIRALCRSWNKDMLLLPCHVCGYTKHVELAHIKSLSSYPPTATLEEVNNPNNVIQLCPNCHWEYDNNKISLPDRI